MKEKPSKNNRKDVLKKVVDFTTALSVDECLQRLIESNQKRIFGNRHAEVVTYDDHFSVNIFTSLPDSDSTTGQARAAICLGDLRTTSDGTQVTAKIEFLVHYTEFEEQHPGKVVFGFWLLWIFLAAVLAEIVLELGLIGAWTQLGCIIASVLMPVLTQFYLWLTAEQIPDETPDIARWLYTLLFEVDDKDPAQAKP